MPDLLPRRTPKPRGARVTPKPEATREGTTARRKGCRLSPFRRMEDLALTTCGRRNGRVEGSSDLRQVLAAGGEEDGGAFGTQGGVGGSVANR